MTLIREWRSICEGCIHYQSNAYWEKEPTCAAFPSGIPFEINGGGFDHRRHYETRDGNQFTTDNGVLFEQAPGWEAREALFRYEIGLDDYVPRMRLLEKETGVTPLIWDK